MIRLALLMSLALSAKAVTLNPTPLNHVYLIYNASSQVIWLNHESPAGMSAGWVSQIWPSRYSALVLSPGKSFKLVCQNESFKRVSCDNRLRVSLLSLRSPKRLSGGYWLVENASPTTGLLKLGLRGVSIRSL